MWLELLHGLGGVVEEGKAGALATTKLCPEAEDGDLVLGGLVELRELLAELILGHVGARWVEDVTVGEMVLVDDPGLGGGPARDGDGWGELDRGEYAHDHLLASQQWVADELARAQSNLCVGHYCGVDGREGSRDACVAWRSLKVSWCNSHLCKRMRTSAGGAWHPHFFPGRAFPHTTIT